MAIMETGKLTRRVEFQSLSSEQDAFGQPIETWTPFYTCWANIDVVRGQLIYSTAEFISKATQQITIRYTKLQTFTSGNRIVYVDGGTKITHTYEIEAVVNPMQGNAWLQLLCYEIAPTE